MLSGCPWWHSLVRICTRMRVSFRLPVTPMPGCHSMVECIGSVICMLIVDAILLLCIRVSFTYTFDCITTTCSHVARLSSSCFHYPLKAEAGDLYIGDTAKGGIGHVVGPWADVFTTVRWSGRSAWQQNRRCSVSTVAEVLHGPHRSLIISTKHGSRGTK